MDSSAGLPRVIDLDEAARLLGLAEEGVVALAAAGYLHQRDGRGFALGDVKALQARLTDDLGIDVLAGDPALVDPRGLLDALDGKSEEMARRAFDIFQTVFPEASTWAATEQSRFIEQAIITGAEKKFVGALVVPAFAALSEWCKQQGYDTSSHQAMISNPAVHTFYRSIIDDFNQQFNHVEQVKKFELLPEEWSVESGELTPKLSIRRKIVLDKYKSYIEKIYS